MKDFTKYKLNLKRSPIDDRDWKYETLAPEITFPDALDLRDAMFPVRDQGSQGSCAAMSGGAVKDWQETLDVNIEEYMSPQFIYFNREDRYQEGMYMRDLMKIMKNLGTCVESSHPYGNLGTPSNDAYDEAKNFVIQGYADVSTINGLKTALADDGPCVIAVPVYNYGPRLWHQFSGQNLLGGHAMTIVGYNAEGFIIRNSWGDDWEDGGHTIFPYTDWGEQWEVWSTVDAPSGDVPDPDPEPNPGCLFGRVFNIFKK
jgi:C1A family cysteine protease